MRRQIRLSCAVVCFSLLVASGCGKKQVPVQGKLIYADTEEPVKELAGFQVIFTSNELKISARGNIKPDGTFELGSLKDNDGTLPGEYVVTVTQPRREPERPNVGDRVVEQSYESPETSDLRAEVKNEKNEFTFKLRRIVKSP